MRTSLARTLTAVLVLFAMLVQGSWALAGTTGGISGVLSDTSGTVVSGARVTAVSPSQTATVTTDSAGRFNFVSLAPDTYTLSFEKQGYQNGSQAGVTVQADQNVTINLSAARVLQTIGRTAARSSNSLVRAGQTASEYSVTPSQQTAVAALGGGTNLNSAYSAIASVPGVTVPLGNQGWGQSIFIRGGDYTQTGNEVDGIPINRSFDQYASGALSSLGSQEVQVYTGNAPADAQAVGLSGFINQVIKTGTYPGNISADIGVGTPGVYNHANFEIAGASPDRLDSYYIGTGGYSQSLRTIDQFNGVGYLNANGLGAAYNYVATGCGTAHPSAGCYQNASPFLGSAPFGPNGYAQADVPFGAIPYDNDRETVANLHFGIKHPHDGNHDDVQVLYDYENIRNYPNFSMDSWGPFLNDVSTGSVGSIPYVPGACPAPAAGGGTGAVATTCVGPIVPAYLDYNEYTGPLNSKFTAGNVNNSVVSLFPNSPSGRVLGAPVDFARQDGETNQFAIFKAQYQHNIADKGYIRLYGYSLYSDRIDNGIVGVYQAFQGAFEPDYTISAHTKGVVLNGGYQLTPQHLLNVNVGYTTSTADRFNNETTYAPQVQSVYLLNSSNPTGGCYSGAGLRVSCTGGSAAGYILPGVNSSGGLTPLTGSPVVGTENSLTCGTAACQYYAINNGQYGTLNTVTPKFLNASIADTWKPTAKLSIDASLRSDTFSYVMQNTDTLGNELFVNDYNAQHCVAGTSVKAIALGGTCPAGYVPTQLSASSPNLTYADVLQPRLGATYAAGPNDVFRASYGRFVQPAETSAVQATNVQSSVPSVNFFTNFGFSSYARPVEPEVSYNTDFSWEHQFRNTDLSSRLTPFYRRTQDEFASVLVDPKTNFVAEVNGENRTAAGFEFALNKGDFARNGLAAQLSYTYTFALAHYKVYPNGGSFVTTANQAIGTFNQYTSFCAKNPTDSRCTVSGSAGITAAPCYAAGTPDPTCSLAGTIANPYYNSAPQALLNPNAAFVPYNESIGANADSTSYIIPHVLSLVVQYKKDRLKVTPSLQFEGGARYGTPFSSYGVAPDSCSALTGNPTAVGDPRYAGTGVTAGGAYDASTCTGYLNVPDSATGHFDGIGQFVQPNLLNGNLQVSYDFSSHMSLQITAANIYSQCFGGSNVPWAIGGRLGCAYANTQSVGNFYNPGDRIQTGFTQPYGPVLSTAEQAISQQANSPFQLFVELKFNKL